MAGQLIEGRWETQSGPATRSKSGAFERKPTTFRNWIAPGGEFAAEAGRYHLYVSSPAPGRIAR